MELKVLVKAKAIRLWRETGEVDVEILVGGQPVTLTLNGDDVIKIPVLCHWSDCSLHNEPAYPAKPCDCGIGIGIKEVSDETRRD